MESIKILFVEDEAIIREELGQFFQRYTKENLYIAKNGEEGLALYEKYHPDIVISDIKMPKMTGIEMVKKIKASNPDQAVIFTTAHSDSSFFLEAIELQVSGYLLKPVDLSLLDKNIKEVSEHILLRKKYMIQKTIMNEIAHLQQSMLAVLDKDLELLFLNDKTLAFLGVESLEEALTQNKMISSRMVEWDDYFYPSEKESRRWLEEIERLEPHKRMVVLSSLDEKSTDVYLLDISHSKRSGYTIVSLSEITKMEEEKAAYKKRVYTDDLTQTYNRSMFNKRLNIQIKEAIENNSALSMIVLDLDHFKKINDTYGHMIGDEVLIGLSTLIKNQIRSHDLFARWGGEEFALLLPDTDIEGARVLAENLRKMIEEHRFSMNISLTCSFGLASLKEETDTCLFRQADEALYRAKLNGRNRVVIY